MVFPISIPSMQYLLFDFLLYYLLPYFQRIWGAKVRQKKPHRVGGVRDFPWNFWERILISVCFDALQKDHDQTGVTGRRTKLKASELLQLRELNGRNVTSGNLRYDFIQDYQKFKASNPLVCLLCHFFYSISSPFLMPSFPRLALLCLVRLFSWVIMHHFFMFFFFFLDITVNLFRLWWISQLTAFQCSNSSEIQDILHVNVNVFITSNVCNCW